MLHYATKVKELKKKNNLIHSTSQNDIFNTMPALLAEAEKIESEIIATQGEIVQRLEAMQKHWNEGLISRKTIYNVKYGKEEAKI